jgi:hypothetical protein
MAVPDTNTFSLKNVQTELSLPATTDLSTCYNTSVDALFDSLYKGFKNSLYNFRNYGASGLIPFLIFTTNAYANPFDPVFTASSGILNWNLGDVSNNVNANSFTHTYAGSGNKTVSVYAGTTAGASSVTALWMDSDNLVGTLDISCLINLGQNLVVNDNTSLTSLIVPYSTQNFANFFAYNCDLTGTLNVSPLISLGGSFRVENNPKLTTIINPSSNDTFEYYYAYDCSLSSTLNCASILYISDFRVQNNTNLTSIKNPYKLKNTSYALNYTTTYYYAYNCNLTGTLDCSGIRGMGGYFDVHDNPLLTKIIHFDSSANYLYYYAYDCDLTGTLDVSCIANLGLTFDVHNNRKLTKILNPKVEDAVMLYYYAYDCSLSGTLDCSTFTFLEKFDVHGNQTLQYILNAKTSEIGSPGAISTYHAYNCNLTGTLDISCFKYFGADFDVHNNPNLQYIRNPSTVSSMNNYRAYDCNLTGTLDWSKVSELDGIFDVHNNPNLTSIINPNVTTGDISVYDANHCNLTGTLDISSLRDLRYVNLEHNSKLQTIRFPFSTGMFTSAFNCPIYNINARDCSLSRNNVDTILTGLLDYYNYVGSITRDVCIYLDGGATQPPSYGWSAPSIIGLFSAFGGSAYDISIRINTGTLSVNPTSKNFTKNGGTQNITVTASSGNYWVASDSCTWLSITNESSTGNGVFTINCTSQPGAGDASRNGAITVLSAAPTVTIIVTQDASVAPPDYVTPEWYAVEFDSTGACISGDCDVLITSSGTWTTSKIDLGDGTSWYVPTASGSSGQNCSISCGSGYSGPGRTGDIRVTSGTAQATINVYQYGP